MPWRPVLGAVAALLGGAVLALSIVPLGVYDTLVCAVSGAGCETKEPPPLPEPKAQRLTPVQAAAQGRYAAIGDSYASGEGAYEQAADRAYAEGSEACRRSRGSYFEQVSKAFPFKRGGVFWACSGATTRNVLGRGMHGEPAQVNQIDAKTSLVTVSVGGNDIGYSQVLKTCIIKLPWSSACTAQEPKVRSRIAAMQAGVRRIVTAIARRAPKARILLVGYPRPFPARPRRTYDNIGVDDQRWINRMARTLNDALAEVATTADGRIARARAEGTVEFVDAYDAFDGHEVGTDDPYIFGVGVDLSRGAVKGESYHPTRRGYQRLGEVIRDQIKAGPGRPINQFRTRGLLDNL